MIRRAQRIPLYRERAAARAFFEIMLPSVYPDMDDQQFRLKADEALNDLYNALVDAGDEHDFEADLGDALTVEFAKPAGKFVISPNAPVKQIWVSALSKSFKLAWDDSRGSFVLPETGETLKEVVAGAVSRQIGETVSL